MIVIIRNGTDQYYNVSMNCDQGFWRDQKDKIFKGNITNSHNSAINHRTGTGLGQCTTRYCILQSYKVSSKSKTGF